MKNKQEYDLDSSFSKLQAFLFILSVGLFLLAFFLIKKEIYEKSVVEVVQEQKYDIEHCLNINVQKTKNVAEQVDTIFTKIDYTEKDIISTDKISPVFFSNFMAGDSPVDKKYKSVFIRVILPLIIRIEEKIKVEKELIASIENKVASDVLTDSDIQNIRDLAKKYNVQIQGDNIWDYVKGLDILEEKVDFIPHSLLLAIIIHDTDWGRNKKLMSENLLFSYSVMNDFKTILLEKRGSIPKLFGMSDFKRMEDSLRVFYNHVNKSDFYYVGFRKKRAEMRKMGFVSAYRLMDYFIPESDGKNHDYLVAIKKISADNYLAKYDSINGFSDRKEVCIIMR